MLHTTIVANVAQLIAMDDFGKDGIFMGVLVNIFTQILELNSICNDSQYSSIFSLNKKDLKSEHETMGKKNTNIVEIDITAKEIHITINSDVFNVIQFSEFTSYTSVIRSSYNLNSGNDTGFIEVIKVILNRKNIFSGTSYVEDERLSTLLENKKNAIDHKLDSQEVYMHAIKPDFQQDHLISCNAWWVTEYLDNTVKVSFITDSDHAEELKKHMEYLASSVELEEILLTHPAVADVAVIGQNLTEYQIVYVDIVAPYKELKEKSQKKMQERLGRRGFGTVYRAKFYALGEAITEIDLETDEN
ncbi:14161_t:CDS:2, partial [Gigaspora margarita]